MRNVDVIKKVFISAMIAFVACAIALLCSGCGTKASKTTSDFISIATSNNLQTKDATSQFSQYKNVVNYVTLAQADDWQVEFFDLKTKEDATATFDKNYNTFKTYEKDSSAHVSTSNDSYSEYTLVTDVYYMHLCQVDNTVLYAQVPIKYKEDAEKFIQALGY